MSKDILHWFCFSYTGKASSNGSECQASTYTGYNSRNINIEKIEENKGYAGVTKDAVLVSCSYLGYMTREEMGRK